jgi:NADH:ubiquinone oxidoreductase subunit 6 (subunit J)
MVVLRMHRLSEDKGVAWAAISILSLVLVLIAMTSVSGGFTGFSGTIESLAYAGAVMIPLLVVVFLALWKPVDSTKKQQEALARVPVKD